MKNLTITLPESVLDRLRAIAGKRGVSVNKLARELLTSAAGSGQDSWEEDFEALQLQFHDRKTERPWKREDLYQERSR